MSSGGLALCTLVVVAHLTLHLASVHGALSESFPQTFPSQLAGGSQRGKPQQPQRTFSLTDILNQRISDESEACPERNVILFFLTNDESYLRPCLRQSPSNQTFRDDRSGSTAQTNEMRGDFPPSLVNSQHTRSDLENPKDRHSKSDEPKVFSGRLLKRILQNMDSGNIRTDFPQPDQPSLMEKRARLSINSALTSLADMLRHESSRHSRPQYAFHSDLLKLGK